MAKNLIENMSNSDTDTELARELGLGAAMSIGIGTMICAGIFVLPGIAAAKAGPIVVLAFALCGLVAVLIALCMSELSTGRGRLPVRCKVFRPNDGLSDGGMSVVEPHICIGFLYGGVWILCGGSFAYTARSNGSDHDRLADRAQLHRRQRDRRYPECHRSSASHYSYRLFLACDVFR